VQVQFQLKSYDRLFPNQDTMSEGGCGNLMRYLYRSARAQKAALSSNNLRGEQAYGRDHGSLAYKERH